MGKLVRVSRGNPFEFLQGELDRLYTTWPSMLGEGRLASGAWIPLDLIEGSEGYRVVAEVPGVPKDAVSVSVEANVLTVRVQREVPPLAEGESLHVRERVFGEFSRSVSLPRDIDVDSITAEYVDGVLTVTIGKSERSKPRQIEIKAH
jgi:HSP20 family protein